MMFRIDATLLRQGRWYEHVLRFGLGVVVTVLAGIIADRWGPAIGGVFLAFAAIFCASSTMIEKHERARKRRDDLERERRARERARRSLGLVAFALVVWLLAPCGGLLTPAVAAVVWLFVSVAIWRLQRAL